MYEERDVIIITVDCWRHDTIKWMPALRSATSSFQQAEAICQSAATPGVFPAILASQYYPEVYTSKSRLKQGTQTLPHLLSEEGYRTGAVVADNPHLNRFENDFDYFWNGRSAQESKIRKISRIAAQRDTVPASDAVMRAKKWFKTQNSPRFLLIHLMEPHEPYLPGLTRGWREGPIQSYRALLQFSKDRNALSDRQVKTIRGLYQRCIQLLDTQIGQLFSFIPDDAIVVLMGDHGEEFDHGALRHARLYDEVVRVPLFTRNLSASNTLPEKIRQIDIAPLILDRIGHQCPTEWNGSSKNEERETMILNTSPHLGETYVAIRTRNHKLIKVYKEGSRNLTRTEFYNLSDDPREKNNLYDSTANTKVETLESAVQDFITNKVIDTGIECDLSPPVGNAKATEAVNQRLEALGYR